MVAKKRKKGAAELRAENRFLRRMRISHGLGSVLSSIIRWGGAVLIARYGYLIIQVLAGQTTTADIGISFLGELKVSKALAWIFGGSGVFYGIRQRKLRRDTVERLQNRIKGLELKIDPKRSSSTLTERGETRPEDEQ